MNKRIVVALLLGLGSGTAAAGELSFGYDWWSEKVSGVVDTRGQRIDLEHDVDLTVHSKSTFNTRWDTSGEWVPDFLADYRRIEVDGRHTVSSSTLLGTTTTTILANANLGDVQATARYPWRSEHFVLWGGVTVKRLAGDLTTQNQNETQETRERVNETFPMLHGGVEVPLGSRLRLASDLDWISSGGDRALQWRAGVDLQLWGPLGLSGGWQRRHYVVHSNSDSLDATLGGGAVGAFLRWTGE
jgi:hypothetical protein